jgi:hypothetical protein
MDKNVLLEALASALAEQLGKPQYKHDLATGFTLTTNLMHGQNGIFGVAGVGPDIFSTRIKPRGILSVLPSIASVDTHPIVGYLTGFTAGSGDEPSTPCAECVKPGNVKACYQGSRFGLICRETDELDISRVGERVNRSEYFDLRLVNDPLLNDSPNWVPASVPKGLQQILNSEVLARWLTLGVAFEQKLAELVWIGNPANNLGTGYAEPLGLQSLVTATHTDVLDGQTDCPSLASDIKDFQRRSIETNAAQLFEMLTWMWRYVKHNATQMGFMPVEWAFVMKDSLFRKVADFWPCVYASFGCNGTANDVNNNVNGMEMKAKADDLYMNRYLEIDGERVPVIIDDAIPYDISPTGGLLPGEFASDIYLLPFTVRGGVRVFFMEYFDYNATGGVMQQIGQGRLLGDEFFSDNGMFLWTYSRTKWCVNWSAKIEPRYRLLTPQLAGRLMNVRWSPMQAFREPFPNQSYFIDGGRYTSSNAPYTISR